MSISLEHEVISRALFIVGFEPKTSTCQTHRSEPMTTKPTTPSGKAINSSNNQ